MKTGLLLSNELFTNTIRNPIGLPTHTMVSQEFAGGCKVDAWFRVHGLADHTFCSALVCSIFNRMSWPFAIRRLEPCGDSQAHAQTSAPYFGFPAAGFKKVARANYEV